MTASERMPESQDIAALRETAEASFLAVLSEHKPEVVTSRMGEYNLRDAFCCCGWELPWDLVEREVAMEQHLADALAAHHDNLTRAEVERGRALRAAVEALRDEWATQRAADDREGIWYPMNPISSLDAILAAHVPSPLLDGGAGEGDR